MKWHGGGFWKRTLKLDAFEFPLTLQYKYAKIVGGQTIPEYEPCVARKITIELEQESSHEDTWGVSIHKNFIFSMCRMD